MNSANSPLPNSTDVFKSIPMAIVLSLLTFGIYYFFWQAFQMKAMNKLLGIEKYNFWRWALFTFITFGLYHIYYEYVMGTDIILIQKKYGRPETEYLPVICLVLAVFGLVLAADAVQQYELNRLYQNNEFPGLPL